MPTADDRETIPAGLEIHYQPRQPEFDATLNIEVDIDRTGEPRNRLVTIGDSITHGFMSGAIFRTDLSWPAIVAFELGDFQTFRRPVYESPAGPGGIPLDIERASVLSRLASDQRRTGTSTSVWRVGFTTTSTRSRTIGNEATARRRRRQTRSLLPKCDR